MADVEQYAKDLIELGSYAKEFSAKISETCGGSFEWGLNQVITSYLSMFDRFCPFTVGDKVQLTKDTKVDNSSGWSQCVHFMKKGSTAIVRKRGYAEGRFAFHIEFDNETWIDREGNEHPVEQKHLFHFSENSLEGFR